MNFYWTRKFNIILFIITNIKLKEIKKEIIIKDI